MKIRTITSWGLALLALSAQVTQAQNLEDLVQRLVRQTDTLAQRSYDSFSGRRNAEPLRHRSALSGAILECQR